MHLIFISHFVSTDMNFTAVCQNSEMMFYDLRKLGIMDKYIPKFDHSGAEIGHIYDNEDTAFTFSDTSG